MKALLRWLDDRTGYRGIFKELLLEHIPGGARWRYVWGSALMITFLVQVVTGIVLWAAYSPSAQTAWESVYYIEEQMAGGSLLRAIHHYTAQLMTVLLVLHLLQVVIDGAYRAPREVNFWFGMALLVLILASSLTGYLLPWDQKGYWATKVATNLVAITPFIGEDLQRIIVGGADYGHHTLTRFFALHAGVLPALIIGLVVGHIYLFRRHGITAKKPFRKPDAKFWPDQVFKDLVAGLAVLAAVMVLVLWHGGAPLSAPADPAEQFPARPDWYFLFLFQFLKLFQGESIIWGGFIIPGLVFLLVCLMPLIARWRHGHRFNLGFLGALLFGIAFLTIASIVEDSKNEEYQLALELAERDAVRFRELADLPAGIPPSGATVLLRDDPYSQGPRIFASKCASCHAYDGHNGLGAPLVGEEEPTAPDLEGIGSREWLARFLDPEHIESIACFGGTKFVEPDEKGEKSRMVEFVHGLADLGEKGRVDLRKIIAAVSAEAKLESQTNIDARDAALIKEGQNLFFEGIVGISKTCYDCHGFDGEESDARNTPNLTGWGSHDWLIRFTKNPAHSDFYGKANDRMPIFEEDQIFTDQQMEMVVKWLRGEWPTAAEPNTASPASPAVKGR